MTNLSQIDGTKTLPPNIYDMIFFLPIIFNTDITLNGLIIEEVHCFPHIENQFFYCFIYYSVFLYIFLASQVHKYGNSAVQGGKISPPKEKLKLTSSPKKSELTSTYIPRQFKLLFSGGQDKYAIFVWE